MPDLCAFTTAYFTDPSRWRLLRESAVKCGVDLKSYGHVGAYPGILQAKVIDMVAFLEKQTAEYVLYLDSADSFFAYWDSDKARLILDETGKDLIFCAERNCHPYAYLADLYPKVGYPWPWKYLNAGGFFGKRKTALACLDRMIRVQVAAGESDDQAMWTHELLSGSALTLDYDCEIFQSLFLNDPFDVNAVGAERCDGIRNSITGSFPMVIHANGTAPGLRELYRQIYV